MNTNQLNDCLKSDPILAKLKLCQAIPCDLLENVIETQVPRPAALIVNSEPLGQPGEHWLAIFVPEEGPSELFDSFGKAGASYHPTIEAFLKQTSSTNGGIYLTNHRRLQSQATQCCGEYALFYLWHRARGYSLKQILNLFNPYLSCTSDCFVHAAIPRLFRNKTIKTNKIDPTSNCQSCSIVRAWQTKKKQN